MGWVIPVLGATEGVTVQPGDGQFRFVAGFLRKPGGRGVMTRHHGAGATNALACESSAIAGSACTATQTGQVQGA